MSKKPEEKFGCGDCGNEVPSYLDYHTYRFTLVGPLRVDTAKLCYPCFVGRVRHLKREQGDRK